MPPFFTHKRLALCFKLRCEPRTKRIEKPLLALALQSLGFVPHDESWAVAVARPLPTEQAAHAGACVVWCRDATRDPRTIFSHQACKSQRICIATPELRASLEDKARTAYVWTTFKLHAEARDKLRARLQTGDQVLFQAARLLAFAAEFPLINLEPPRVGR